MAFFQAGDVRLLLGLPEKKTAEPSSIVYFKVDDMNTAYRTLTERGVAFTHEPRIVHRGEQTDVWLAHFQDPDHNELALMSETPRRDCFPGYPGARARLSNSCRCAPTSA